MHVIMERMLPRGAAWLERVIAGSFAGWAVARLTGADRFPIVQTPTASLLSFTPQVAGGAWLSALLSRDDRARATGLVAAGILTAVVVPRALRWPQPAATGPELRVMTVNLKVGRAEPDPLISLARLAAADVLFLQELNADAAAGLRRAGLDELFGYSVSDLGRVGSRGNGIYARYPLTEGESSSPGYLPASLAMPLGSVRLASVHLRPPKPPWSRAGAARWRTELSALPDVGGLPVILAGDFNSTIDHAPFRRLLSRGYVDAAGQSGRGLVPTWGTAPGGGRGVLTIDHVLTDRRCAVLASSVHRLPGTDHRAVVADLRLPAPA
jgi:endonuclease/exonuclease/phosphatase family metal-dependent hydrolase